MNTLNYFIYENHDAILAILILLLGMFSIAVIIGMAYKIGPFRNALHTVINNNSSDLRLVTYGKDQRPVYLGAGNPVIREIGGGIIEVSCDNTTKRLVGDTDILYGEGVTFAGFMACSAGKNSVEFINFDGRHGFCNFRRKGSIAVNDEIVHDGPIKGELVYAKNGVYIRINPGMLPMPVKIK